MSTVAVVDYGMGNLHSIAKALQHVADGTTIQLTADVDAILAADRVVFPGVGAISDCMAALGASGLADAIRCAAVSKPVLGICLGLQALFDDSTEGRAPTPGLGLIPGKVVRFAEPLLDLQGQRLKVPHMGWNEVRQTRAHPLWEGIRQDTRFYFVHSYYAVPRDTAVIAATTDYPVSFASAIAYGKIFAVQFHPEKSQAGGLQLLANFLTWNGD